jgi:hypothetical protein
VGPLGLSDGAFDGYMVYFLVVISMLPLGVKIGVGTSGDYEYYTMGGEGIILLLGFLDLWQRWRWWAGIVWHWVGDLQSCWWICYLWSWRRVHYSMSW